MDPGPIPYLIEYGMQNRAQLGPVGAVSRDRCRPPLGPQLAVVYHRAMTVKGKCHQQAQAGVVDRRNACHHAR